MRLPICSTLVGVLGCAVVHGVSGQPAKPSAPTAWGLFSVRYDTHSSDFIYAVYGYGRSFAMVGALQNPRSGFTELLGAVGRNFTIRDGQTQSVALGAARTDNRWYTQLYYLPDVRIGALDVRATSEWDVPVSRGGMLQFGLSPLSATVPAVRSLAAGLSLDLGASQGDRTTAAIGPELRLALPNAVLGTDVQRMLNSNAGRVRLFFTTQF